MVTSHMPSGLVKSAALLIASTGEPLTILPSGGPALQLACSSILFSADVVHFREPDWRQHQDKLHDRWRAAKAKPEAGPTEGNCKGTCWGGDGDPEPHLGCACKTLPVMTTTKT